MAVQGERLTRATAVEERSWRLALWAVFAVTVARLVWLAVGHADLYPDEAQYWLWSLHPAFGYYSKPPLVAWLIAATTALFGEDELAIRLAAPLLHFGASLVIFAIGRRLYDARVAMWSAIAYATVPGVSASAALISTDAPLLFCWAVALYALIRAREPGGERWWIAVGIATGFGLLAKYAMAYWLLSGLLFLLLFRDERRHLKRFLGATAVALAIYAPNFIWNALNGFVSYRHTRDNAHLGGPLLHPTHFLEFLGSQFGVFGPIFFAVLILVALTARRSLRDRRAGLVAVSVALHLLIAVAIFGAHDAAAALRVDLPAKWDLLHRLRGWSALGRTVSQMLLRHPGTILLSDDREDMAVLMYYVHPHPFDALKWNGEGGIHDGFDLTAQPSRYVGRDFLLVTHTPDNIERILSRFDKVDRPPDDIIIPLDRKTARRYEVYWLHGFKGYR